MNDISIEYLKEALEYTPESGVIRWKQRPKTLSRPIIFGGQPMPILRKGSRLAC
jgi:predicted metal-binding protein